MTDNSRIRPYLDTKVVILLERLQKIENLSMGKIITLFLFESDTFKILLESYYDATDEELKKIFLGLPFHHDKCKNITIKKEKEIR